MNDFFIDLSMFSKEDKEKFLDGFNFNVLFENSTEQEKIDNKDFLDMIEKDIYSIEIIEFKDKVFIVKIKDKTFNFNIGKGK